jgi:hypothetical protein
MTPLGRSLTMTFDSIIWRDALLTGEGDGGSWPDLLPACNKVNTEPHLNLEIVSRMFLIIFL